MLGSSTFRLKENLLLYFLDISSETKKMLSNTFNWAVVIPNTNLYLPNYYHAWYQDFVLRVLRTVKKKRKTNYWLQIGSCIGQHSIII